MDEDDPDPNPLAIRSQKLAQNYVLTPGKRFHASLSTSPSPQVAKSFRPKVINNTDDSSARRSPPSSSFPPFAITFSSRPEKSPFKLIKELMAFWKSKTTIDLTLINLSSRFGHEGKLLLLPRDSSTFDALQVVPWPDRLDSISIVVNKPVTVPVHHSLVVHDICLDTDFDDVKECLEETFGRGSVIKIARLIHPSARPLWSIRVDFSSSVPVSTLLDSGFVNLLFSRHPVKPYHFPSRVPVCFNCHQHGHLVKECKNKATCARCGLDHVGECQASLKCVNCGGNHFPGQSACPEVQKRRQTVRTYAQATAPELPPLPLSTRSLTNAIPPVPPTHPLALPPSVDIQLFISHMDKRFDELKVDLFNKIQNISAELTRLKTIVDDLCTYKIKDLKLIYEKHMKDVQFEERKSDPSLHNISAWRSWAKNTMDQMIRLGHKPPD
jgi:hypothetical protein